MKHRGHPSCQRCWHAGLLTVSWTASDRRRRAVLRAPSPMAYGRLDGEAASVKRGRSMTNASGAKRQRSTNGGAGGRAGAGKDAALTPETIVACALELT